MTLGTGVVYTGTYLYFDAGNSTDVSEVFNTAPSTTGNVYTGYGLLTEFTYDAAPNGTSPTPEPTACALLLAGTVSLLSLKLRRKS